ncbi:OmpA family protein [Kutzneria sp. NPDC052558]|uniref:OmpA family protein n=1 Tax=Kutzneria sp. NPDC052558 TaxID=3364121 RepID=UPI0037C6B474
MKRKVLFAALLAIAGTQLCACGIFWPADPPPPVSAPCHPTGSGPLTLAIGARANVPKPQLPADVQGLMKATAKQFRQLTTVRVDGSPTVVFAQQPPKPANNNPANERAAAAYVAAAQQSLVKDILAKAPGADVLAALSLSARATPSGGTVVLVDSGLQTAAPVDFVNDRLLEANPSDVADYLTKENLLPDLKGRTVILVGLGNTAPPQQPLDNNQRAHVVDTWKAVAEKSGACVVTEQQANSEPSLAGIPAVPVVAPPAAPAPNFCGTVELGESDNISFQPDSAAFRSPEAAKDTLRKFADVLRDGRHRADLMGTTASEGPVAGRLELSARRANAVKDVLVGLGVPAADLSARGVGSDWPGHQPDTGPDGQLLPGPAGQNRKVVMTITCPG